MKVGIIKIPVVIVRLIKEVQPVKPFYPADLYSNIEVTFVHRAFVNGIAELVDTYGVFIRYNIPVVGVAVYTWYHVGGELENPELYIRTFERRGR